MAAPRTLGLDNAPLMKTLGFRRLLEADRETGPVRIEFEAKQEQCHSGNIIQGSFVTGRIDSAMAQAAMLKTNHALVPLSLEIKIAFYRAANPGTVVAGDGSNCSVGRPPSSRGYCALPSATSSPRRIRQQRSRRSKAESRASSSAHGRDHRF